MDNELSVNILSITQFYRIKGGGDLGRPPPPPTIFEP